MDDKQCFLTGNKECELVDVSVDGKTYYVSEEVADEMSLKKLKQAIIDKIEESKSKKEGLITKVEEMASSMGVTKEELLALLGGKTPEQVEQEKEEKEQNSNSGARKVTREVKSGILVPQKAEEEDGFRIVSGNLKDVNVNASYENNDKGNAAAHTSVQSGYNSSMRETNKRVKHVDENTVISKSDMGTTVVTVIPVDSDKFNRAVRQTKKYVVTDSNGNVEEMEELVRPNIIRPNNSWSSSATARECGMCGGSGIARVNNTRCPKCGGTGILMM